jgi:hypothetical protein
MGVSAGFRAGLDVPWQRRQSRRPARTHRVPAPRPIEPDPPLDLYEVLDDPAHPASADLGRLLWALVATQWSWVDRRVESASLTGERSFRRRMSIDCRVPPAVVQLAAELGFERFLVPLRFVTKQPLLAFDLRLGESTVPLLTRGQSAQVAEAVLRAAVEPLMPELTPEVGAVIETVASDADEGGALALDLLDLTEPGRTGEDATPAQLARWAITTFDTNYLLLADVSVAEVGQRAIFKVTQEVGPTLHAAHELSVLSSIGWQPAPFILDTPTVTATSSYHFQFDTPPGLVVSGGELFGAVQGDPRRHAFGTSASQGSVLGMHASIPEVPDVDGYYAEVLVHPSPDGLLRSSMVSSCFSTVLLALSLAFATRIDTTRADASAGLLLLLPGIVSTFLARPGEHYWVSRLLRGVRVLTLASAVILYVSAAVLVTGLASSANRWMWLVLTVLSALPSAALLVAVRRCRAVWT